MITSTHRPHPRRNLPSQTQSSNSPTEPESARVHSSSAISSTVQVEMRAHYNPPYARLACGDSASTLPGSSSPQNSAGKLSTITTLRRIPLPTPYAMICLLGGLPRHGVFCLSLSPSPRLSHIGQTLALGFSIARAVIPPSQKLSAIRLWKVGRSRNLRIMYRQAVILECGSASRPNPLEKHFAPVAQHIRNGNRQTHLMV
jgi:hypothetical protein